MHNIGSLDPVVTVNHEGKRNDNCKFSQKHGMSHLHILVVVGVNKSKFAFANDNTNVAQPIH